MKKAKAKKSGVKKTVKATAAKKAPAPKKAPAARKATLKRSAKRTSPAGTADPAPGAAESASIGWGWPAFRYPLA